MKWCPATARGRLLRSATALAAVLSLGACDFPTEAPIFQNRFVIPGENTTLSVNQLLPGSITAANGAFTLSIAPVTVDRTLASLCTVCGPFAGQTIPAYPGFTATINSQIQMPAEVSAATISGGVVQASITNRFGFDPLQPPGSATTGSLRVRLTNNGTVIGDTTYTGPFPNGQTRGIPVRLNTGAVSGVIDMAVTITSPAGGPVTIAANPSIQVIAAPTGVTVSSANVAVSNRAVTVSNVELDLADVDESIADRVVSGAIIVEITNPFAVSGPLTLRISGGTSGDIVKTINLAAGPSATPTTQRIEFSGAELRSILGRDVVMSITGTVNGAAGFVTITPSQNIVIETTLDLVLQIGGEVN